jgi:hypothetical protein
MRAGIAGALPQGRTYILCEQKGGDMRNAEGYRNDWFAYTEAENGKFGWASALDASGGDNYGSFGGGTPNCNGKYGTPPSYNGVWGSPPPPPTRTPVPTPDPATPAVTRIATASRSPPTATTRTRTSTPARPR